MKRTMLGFGVGFCLTLFTLSTFAQGTITFGTYNGANAALGKVLLPASLGGGGVNTDYVGQLYWSDTLAGTYTALDTPQAFNVGVSEGYLTGGSLLVSGRQPGTTLYFQYYVWNSAAGSSYEAALTSPNLIASGITEAKTRVLGGTDADDNIFTPQKVNHFPNLTLTEAAPAPAPPPLLKSTRNGADLTLTWDGSAVLQAASGSCTNFTDVPDATSPYTTDTKTTQKFFRLRQ